MAPWNPDQEQVYLPTSHQITFALILVILFQTVSVNVKSRSSSSNPEDVTTEYRFKIECGWGLFALHLLIVLWFTSLIHDI
ncbi:hypothetical protein DE146DRAFT_641154 [Phaeosphaeria sp. MPI-PUGE-AT-0046c]|nr:hypothetical protein DE146DRAFT_641154 [Phaeosphaeria sp. MPI-PUGE-AT-0046c]